MGKLKQLFMDWLGRMPDDPGYRLESTEAWRLGMTAEHGEAPRWIMRPPEQKKKGGDKC